MSAGPEWEVPPPTPTTPGAPEPMRLGTILDVALRILRRHWAVLLLLALLLFGPGALLTASTGMAFNDVVLDVFPGLDEGVLGDAERLTQAELERLLAALGTFLVATIVAGVLGSIGTLGMSAVVGADYHARRIDLATALRVCLRGTPAALGFMLVSSAIVVVITIAAMGTAALAVALLSGGSIGRGGPGAFVALVIVVGLAVGLAYLTMRWTPAYPAIANEGLGWRAALQRSWYLSGDNVWRIFVVVVMAALATAVISALVSQLLAILLVDVLATSLGLDVVVAGSVAIAAGTVLLAPLAPVLLAVLYFDLRIRRDGTINDRGAAT